jgi:hypothetical protein
MLWNPRLRGIPDTVFEDFLILRKLSVEQNGVVRMGDGWCRGLGAVGGSAGPEG